MKLLTLLNGVRDWEIIGPDCDITNIQIDSRKVTDGSLFICIRGLTVDGHNFIESAIKNGAVAILADNFNEEWTNKTTLVKVKNSREVMSYVAAAFFGNPAEKLKLIGVTGTNGKTTTTQFIYTLLCSLGKKTGLIGTNGIFVNGDEVNASFATSTTPDPLELHAFFKEMAGKGIEYVVMEVSSHALFFNKMDGLQFEVGVFTNLTQDHLDIHGTMENYRFAKSKLFSISNKCVINNDDQAGGFMKSKYLGSDLLTYSIDKASDLKAVNVSVGFGGSKFELLENKDLFIKPSGKFNVYNALAAVGTLKLLGLSMDEILPKLSVLEEVAGRIQAVPNNKGFNVYVDYAHTPDALTNVLTAVRSFTVSKIFTIVGCGGDRDKEKRPIMGFEAGKLSDFVIITSDNPRTEDPMEIIREVEKGVTSANCEYICLENRREAIFKGVGMLTPSDSLVIAGKGHENYQIIGTEKHDFCDFKVASEALK